MAAGLLPVSAAFGQTEPAPAPEAPKPAETAEAPPPAPPPRAEPPPPAPPPSALAPPPAEEDGPPIDEPAGQSLNGLPTNWVVPTSFRNLNGHEFLLTEFHGSPFSTTHFGTVTGLGGASLKTPDRNLSLIGLSQTFNLQIGFIDLITAHAGVSGSALIGVSPDAALFYGAGAGYDIALGASVGKTFGSIRVALALDYKYTKSYNFSVISAIQKSLDAGAIDTTTLLVSSHAHEPKVGLHFAWGIAKYLGVLARFEYARTLQSIDEELKGSNTIGAGATLSFDMNPITPVPLGMLASYGLKKSIGGLAAVHEIVTGVHYTGRTSLSLGPELQIVTGEIAEGSRLSQFSAIFRMRYYW